MRSGSGKRRSARVIAAFDAHFWAVGRVGGSGKTKNIDGGTRKSCLRAADRPSACSFCWATRVVVARLRRRRRRRRRRRLHTEARAGCDERAALLWLKERTRARKSRTRLASNLQLLLASKPPLVVFVRTTIYNSKNMI